MKNIFSKIFYLYLTRVLSLFLPLLVFGPWSVNSPALAQTIVDELKAVASGDLPLKNQIFPETITTISSNRRIYIVTNSNLKLLMGDFVSFIVDDDLIARALVVKTRDDRSGLKLVKIYNQAKWTSLTTGMTVNLLRGDDSYYLSQLKKERESLVGNSTNSPSKTNDSTFTQSDLTADESLILGSEFNFEDKKSSQRKLDADHLLYFTVGNLNSLGIDGGTDTYIHYRVGWGFQIFNNWFTDLSYGHSSIKKYPAVDIDTALNTFTLKFGYIFQLPVHSFLYLYAGVYNSVAVSPGAGEGGVSESQARLETEMVRDLEGMGYIGGLSFYKRLVPGWTFKIDADLKNIGAGIMVEI